MYITQDIFTHIFAFIVFVSYLIAQCTVKQSCYRPGMAQRLTGS